MVLYSFSQASYADITISGSSTIAPIIKSAAKLFSEQTGINIHVTGGGSSVGIADTLSGQSNIGMVSRALSDKEAANLKAATIAYDGVAIIVHSSNAIKKINDKDIARIFLGQVHHWQSIENSTLDSSISIIAKQKGRSTRKIFDHYYRINGLSLDATTIGSNAEALALVGIDRNAIGYASIGAIERAQGLGLRIRPLPINGVEATSHNVENQTFPIRRPLNLVVNKSSSLNKDAKAFLEFMLSNKAKQIIIHKNYIPFERAI